MKNLKQLNTQAMSLTAKIIFGFFNSLVVNSHYSYNRNLTLPVFSVNIKRYSTDSSVEPVKIYANADQDKLQILKDNKGKAGVYSWIHLDSKKTYIGSSIDLERRFRDYYNINYLESVLKRSNSLITRSLLKYGYSNFSLEILEYCEPSETIPREQYYLDKLQPKFNILKVAGSFFGCLHSEESKAKISLALKARKASDETKQKMSDAKKGRIVSDETKAKMSLAKRGENHYLYNKNHSDETKAKLRGRKRTDETKAKMSIALTGRKRPEGAGRPSVSIEIFELETQKKTIYPSISAAARYLGVPDRSIRMYFDRKTSESCRPFKGKYILRKIPS